MPNEIKKYKISDKEGAELFLSINDRDFIDKNAEKLLLEKKRKQKRIRNIVLVSVVFLAAMITTLVFVYEDFQSIRKENLAVNSIVSSVQSMRDQINIASVSKNEFKKNLLLTDSLLNSIDKMIEKYPKEDTLKSLWAVVAMHKYEQKIFDIVRHDRFDKSTKIDSTLAKKVRDYYPELLSVVPILESLVDFNKFAKMHPDPPIVSSTPPKQFFIEELLEKTTLIEDTLKSVNTLIQVEFPVVYTWIGHLSNTIVPNIKDWSIFWDKYSKIIQKGKDDIDSKRQMYLLKQEYPALEILKSNNDLLIGTSRELTLGLYEKSIVPHKKTIYQEWDPILNYISEVSEIKFNLKVFDSNLKLLKSLQSGEVDLAVFESLFSTVSYFSKIGIPVAQRVWDRENLIDNYIVDYSGFTDKNDLLNKKYVLLSPEEFYLFDYFDKEGIDSDTCCSEIVRVENLDTLANLINTGDFDYAVLSSEEIYYIEIANLIKNKPHKVDDIFKSPLSVLWAREGLEFDLINKIQSSLIPMTAKEIYGSDETRDKTYVDWDLYEKNVMKNYYENIKRLMIKYNKVLNKLILSKITPHDNSNGEEIQDAISSFFEKIGFAVVSDKKNISLFEDKLNRFVEVSSTKLSDKEIEYQVDVFQKYSKDESKLIYSVVFTESSDSFPPDFKRKLNDIISYIPVYGRIVKITDSFAYFETSVEPVNVTEKEIYLYKSDIDGDISKDSYGKVKIISQDGNQVKFRIDDSIKNLINVGDIGEIRND